MTAAYTLLTGASSGIGRACALALSHERNLILNGRDVERLDETAGACRAHGHEALIFPYDLAEVATVGAALGAFLLEHGARVEAFVHCAGKTEVLPISKTRYLIGLEVMNVNYFSAVEIISTLLKRKINADALRDILFLTSIAATQGAPHQPHYCASKGALEALRITLARDLAPRVRVNAIAPGSFPTPMWQTPLAENIEGNWNPPTLLPPGEPVEVARAVTFMLSPAARYITGALLPVNGGELLYK